MSQLHVREASLEDASRILEIYAPYIKETTITFEYEVPTVDAFEQRMKGVMKRYPWLVCEEDGVIVGYAYADTYGVRAAYDWCVDMSIYVDKSCRGKGVGGCLYQALLAILKEMHVLNLYSVITGENQNSIAFHKKQGFETFAVYKNSGYKFDRWLDVVWMVKTLGKHENPPKPVIWAPDLPEGCMEKVIRESLL